MYSYINLPFHEIDWFGIKSTIAELNSHSISTFNLNIYNFKVQNLAFKVQILHFELN